MVHCVLNSKDPDSFTQNKDFFFLKKISFFLNCMLTGWNGSSRVNLLIQLIGCVRVEEV